MLPHGCIRLSCQIKIEYKNMIKLVPCTDTLWRMFCSLLVMDCCKTVMSITWKQFTHVQAIRGARSYHDFSRWAWLGRMPVYLNSPKAPGKMWQPGRRELPFFVSASFGLRRATASKRLSKQLLGTEDHHFPAREKGQCMCLKAH